MLFLLAFIRENFFNLHSISEHVVLTENLLIIEILLQAMKLVQFQEKFNRTFSFFP